MERMPKRVGGTTFTYHTGMMFSKSNLGFFRDTHTCAWATIYYYVRLDTVNYMIN